MKLRSTAVNHSEKRVSVVPTLCHWQQHGQAKLVDRQHKWLIASHQLCSHVPQPALGVAVANGKGWGEANGHGLVGDDIPLLVSLGEPAGLVP